MPRKPTDGSTRKKAVRLPAATDRAIRYLGIGAMRPDQAVATGPMSAS